MGQIVSSHRENTLKLSKGPTSKKRSSISKSQVMQLIKQSRVGEKPKRDGKQTSGVVSKEVSMKRYDSSWFIYLRNLFHIFWGTIIIRNGFKDHRGLSDTYPYHCLHECSVYMSGYYSVQGYLVTADYIIEWFTPVIDMMVQEAISKTMHQTNPARTFPYWYNMV